VSETLNPVDNQSSESSEPSSSLDSFLIASGNFFFKFRNGLFPLVFVLLFLFTRPTLFLGNPELDRVVMTLGALIALFGQAFRLFVIGYAYIKRGGKDGKVYADDLVVSGLYAHSRNPMYVGNFLIAVGIGIVYGSPWIYFVVIPFFAYVYLSIVKAEEKYLKSKFGTQYDQYMKTVPRFWPNFKGLRQSLAGYKYDWKKVLRKDYGTVFGTLFGLVFICIWKHIHLYGFSERRAEVFQLALLFIPIVAFYGIVRYLKVNKKLHGTPD
jgi:protein-S-isoprenylcysteine O-methyltransferase Ste14